MRPRSCHEGGVRISQLGCAASEGIWWDLVGSGGIEWDRVGSKEPGRIRRVGSKEPGRIRWGRGDLEGSRESQRVERDPSMGSAHSSYTSRACPIPSEDPSSIPAPYAAADRAVRAQCTRPMTSSSQIPYPAGVSLGRTSGGCHARAAKRLSDVVERAAMRGG